MLQHSDRRDDIVAEAFRVLRPGGYVWVCKSDFTALYFHPPHAALERFVRSWADSMRARGGDPDIGHRVPSMLTDAGFEVVHAIASLEGACRAEYQWFAGGLAVLESAATRGIDELSRGQRTQQQEVFDDLEALRATGWSYFGIWQAVGRKPNESFDA